MHFNKKKLSEICAATLIAGGAAALAVPTIAIAATAAGTLIKNLATVTYEDANGNQYSAQSNEAVITVKQVYSAEISEDTTKTAAAGQSVYIQHTLTNTGNGTDTYTLTAVNDSTITDDIDSGSIKIYLDANGNGLADAGEQEITGDITLEAGKSAEIVMEVAVPNTAQAGNTLGVILTAQAHEGTGSAVANSVDDTTTGNGTDGAEGTNQDLITVSDNAVLNYTKSAILDEVNSTITYTLTVTNTGNQTATDVVITDNLPKGMMPSGIPTANGISSANAGDVLPTFSTVVGGADETADLIDYNNDGDTADVLDSYTVSGTDASIAPGQTISISFVADYDPAMFNNDSTPGSANDIVKNIASLTADLDGPGPDTPVTISSNPTQTTLPQLFGVATDDTNAAPGDGVNDGGDDNADGTTPGNTVADDTQHVNEAPSGSTVLFKVVITNNGTGPDTFDISHNSGTFPAGTTFTYWDESGNVPLVDTNGEAGPDSGLLDSGASRTIMVKAKLPAGVSGSAGYTATITSTSSEDPSATPQSDDATLSLGAITAPGVDLRDTNTPDAGSDDDALSTASGEYVITSGSTTYTGTVGGVVKIPFYIDNNSGSSDAFQLSAGSSWDSGSQTVGALPTGWDVKFYKADGSGEPTGQPLNSTELLAPNSVGGSGSAAFNQYVAVVSIPAVPSMAPANYVADNDADLTAESMDSNSDGDGDQPIFIRIVSANSGSSDIMVDAIDVTSIRDISLTPPGANQIQPGGSVDYTHALVNTGNTDEELELASSNSLSGDNWTNNVFVPVDNDGDGTIDEQKPLSQLVPGTDRIVGTDPDGNLVPMDVTDNNAAPGVQPAVNVPAGVSIPMTPTVYAPANAPSGTLDTLTVSATSTNGGPNASVEDISEVIVGQVRLTKRVAYDPDCTAGAGLPGAFAANLTTQIAPGECAVWEIVAENQGDAPARNVVIRDEVTAFTSYDPNSLQIGDGAGSNPSTFTTVTDAADTDGGQIVGNAVTFFVGNSPDPANNTGGTILPGEFATVRFSTKID